MATDQTALTMLGDIALGANSITGQGRRGIYAESYMQGNSTASGTITAGTWEPIGGVGVSGSSGGSWTHSTANGGSLTLDEASYSGDFLCVVSASFSGDSAVEYYLRVDVEGVTQPQIEARRKLGAGGDVGCISMSGIVSLTQNDTVSIVADIETGTGTVTVESYNLTLKQV